MSARSINQTLARDLREYARELEERANDVDNGVEIVASEYTRPVLQTLTNRLAEAMHELAIHVEELQQMSEE